MGRSDPMRCLVLFNADGNLQTGADIDAAAVTSVRDMAVGVVSALRELGHEVTPQAIPDDLAGVVRLLRTETPDLVFNLVESIRGDARFEAAASWVYEWEGVLYTGSPPAAQTIGLDKPTTRAVLAGRGVPIALGATLATGDEAIPGRGPWIVKPSREDASHGIDLGSVVIDEDAVRSRARLIHKRFREPALVEEFIDGREFNVAVLGHGRTARALPLAEIDFSGFPKGAPRLITYAAKWDEASAEFRGTVPGAPKSLDPDLAAEIVRIALAAYDAIGLRDYGRIDLRVSERHGPVVIDVNPNPDISPDAGLAKAAARGGMSYVELIRTIVESARARRRP